MDSAGTQERRSILRLCMSLAITASLFVLIPGCGSQEQWEITFENKSEVPCSIFVTMGDGSTTANVADVAKCEATSMIVGPGETIVLTVKVVRGEEEEVLTPNTKLIPGKRFAIVVEEDGKVVTSVVDR